MPCAAAGGKPLLFATPTRRVKKGGAERPTPFFDRDDLASGHGCVTVSPVTIASVLCAKRTPYTPSIDFSFPAPTTADFG